MKTAFTVLLCVLASGRLFGAEIHPPAEITAGSAITIPASGFGRGTFYLIGPANAIKRTVEGGGDIAVEGDQLERAGRYIAILCASGGCTATNFWVKPAAPNRVNLLVHPSRVPVAMTNGITTVAFIFDNFQNLVVESVPVKFSILPREGNELSATRQAQAGVAWVSVTSARKEGATRIAASVGHANEVRLVQQVASEACNLRIKATRAKNDFLIETDPVRDCTGNAVPDGTIVSFTMSDSQGKTTVDVPIKRGVARIELAVKGRARIAVASGVVTGNELEFGGG
jgi:hypothetical protein